MHFLLAAKIRVSCRASHAPTMSTSGNWWDKCDDGEKYNKFEAEYAQRLMKKYFSEENIFGEKAYEKEVKIGDETIKSSRWRCVQSYADPVQSFKDGNRASASASASVIPTQSFKDPYAARIPVPVFKDPNTALAPVRAQSFKAPNAASSASVHFRNFKVPNPAMASVPVQSFKDPNVALSSVPVQSFKDRKGKSPSTWRPSANKKYGLK